MPWRFMTRGDASGAALLRSPEIGRWAQRYLVEQQTVLKSGLHRQEPDPLDVLGSQSMRGLLMAYAL